MSLERPEEVGSDRIVNALAAYIITAGPVLIVDCGTALTWCYVDGTGTYQGGAIFPGTQLCTQALADHTAKVGHVTFSPIKDPYGKTTEMAVKSGISQIFAHGLNGVISGFKTYVPDITVIGTGNGLWPLKGFLKLDRYEPHLIFHGLTYCARKIAPNV
jgi:type III pantothenate kinase